MRFTSIHIQNVGPFENVAIDFDALPGLITAIVGENGAGKSTLLECLAASMYRELPTRGPLVGIAKSRTSSVQTGLVNGRGWHITHRLDSVSGKSEAVVLDDRGGYALPDTKVKSFDGWAAKTFPPPEVFYAGPFSQQKIGRKGISFLYLTDGERKAAILRTLGVERLEALAEKAREKMRAAKGKFDVVDARLRDAGGAFPGMRAATVDESVALFVRNLEDARAESARAAEGAEAAQVRLAAVRAEADEVAAHNDARRRVLEAMGAADRDRIRASQQVDDLQRRLAGVRETLAAADWVRDAVVRLAELDAALGVTRERFAEARAKATAAAQRTASARVAQTRAVDAVRGLIEQRRRESERLQGRAAVAQEAGKLDGARTALADATRLVGVIQAELDEARSKAVAGAEERAGALRTSLATYTTSETWDGGTEARGGIAADDAALRDRVDRPKAIAALTKGLTDARAEEAKHRRAVDSAERASAQLATFEAAERRVAELAAELERVEAERVARGADVDEAMAHEQQAIEALTAFEAEGRRLAADRALADPVAQRAQELAGAEALATELGAQIEAARVALGAAAEAYRTAHAVPYAAVDRAAPDVDGALRAAREADRAAADARAAVPALEARLADVRAAAERLVTLEAEHRAAEEELADFTRLGNDLGRDGLQAALVDGVGPELTALTNDLLHTCVGPRWTVAIETQRSNASGKKTIEGCSVRVIDSEEGREGAAESLSGGEGVIVGEAISLALSALACRKWGVDGATLVRDETGAALSPANAKAYVAMLRRAASIVGAARVLLVTHLPEVQDLCDSKILIDHGRVTIAAA